jgi:glutaredoxin
MPVATDDVVLYWIQGCGNCTRLKGYLGEHGVAFRSVNVMDDLDAVEEIRRMGILGLPVLRVGDRWVGGTDLSQVDALLGLDPDPAGRLLAPAELAERAARLLDTASALAGQLPPEHHDDPTPTMERFAGAYFTRADGRPYVPHGSFKSLVHHIAGHGEKFKRIALSTDGVHVRGFDSSMGGEAAAFGEPDPATPMYLVVAQMRLAAADIRAWAVLDLDPDLGAVTTNANGEQTTHQSLQTHLCSLVQHTRQLTEVVEERLGITPAERVHAGDLEGLLMPAGVWQ